MAEAPRGVLAVVEPHAAEEHGRPHAGQDLGRFDAFFWIYTGINLLYLARGWLGLILRFGRS
jgi:hypothetical protein